MEPTWPQDAQDALAWADTCAHLEKPALSYVFFFKNLETQKGAKMAQERAKVGPRVGAKIAQESAKIEPRWPSWSQDEANMAPR